MLLGTLGASSLGNMLAGKRAKATSEGSGVNKADKETTRAGLDFVCRLILSLILKQKDIIKMTGS